MQNKTEIQAKIDSITKIVNDKLIIAKKLAVNHETEYQSVEKEINTALQTFIQVNLKAFEQAKTEEKKKSIIDDLTFAEELLTDPTDNIKKCYERADARDKNHELWNFLARVLFFSSTITVIASLFLFIGLTAAFMPPAFLFVGTIASILGAMLIGFPQMLGSVYLNRYSKTPTEQADAIHGLKNIAKKELIITEDRQDFDPKTNSTTTTRTQSRYTIFYSKAITTQETSFDFEAEETLRNRTGEQFSFA